MKKLPVQKRTLALLVLFFPVAGLFIYVALRSGPLAPIPVTVSVVETRAISPALFGIGTVEARYTYKIGPTSAGKIRNLEVQVGDRVEAGQVLGEMDPVDLDAQIQAREAALKSANAQRDAAEARQRYAQTQAQRYEQLLAVRSTSEETVVTKQQELQVAEAEFNAAREECFRLEAEHKALVAVRANLRFIAPVDGLVVARNADPGTTIVAGETLIEMIDPESMWVNVRFDQIHAGGLAAGLPVQIVLRSQRNAVRAGHILRVEPVADEVTEETLAKVRFDDLPDPLPSIGELAEATVTLPAIASGPVVPNAAIQRVAGSLGVWQVVKGDLRFTPVSLGSADLDGQVQVRDGLKARDRVVVYSAAVLQKHSRFRVVDQLSGVKP
jgi:RND family efflux transporter MFP subunit